MIVNRGEVRRVGIEVVNELNQDFVIEGADYEIAKANGDIIDKGYATVEGHKIITLFSATNAGQYYCNFTYRIAAEILKAKVYIQVH